MHHMRKLGRSFSAPCRLETRKAGCSAQSSSNRGAACPEVEPILLDTTENFRLCLSVPWPHDGCSSKRQELGASQPHRWEAVCWCEEQAIFSWSLPRAHIYSCWLLASVLGEIPKEVCSTGHSHFHTVLVLVLIHIVHKERARDSRWQLKTM